MDKEETEYMLRWSEHSAQVMATFTQVGQQNVMYERKVSKVRIMLQLWELGQLTDVTLATEERVFQAHRALLAACSPYFRQLFVTIPSQVSAVSRREVSLSVECQVGSYISISASV